MGLTPDPSTVPDTFTPDRRKLTEENFDDTYNALVSTYDRSVSLQAYPQLRLAETASPSSQSGASGTGRLYLSVNEDADLNMHMPAARDYRIASSVCDTLASVLGFIPEINVNLTFPTKVPSDSLGYIESLKRTSDKSLFPMALGSCGHRITHQLRPINMNGRSILAVTSNLHFWGVGGLSKVFGGSSYQTPARSLLKFFGRNPHGARSGRNGRLTRRGTSAAPMSGCCRLTSLPVS